MPEDFQNESHLNFPWMQLFVVGMIRCYVNLLVNARTKLRQMLVFIWRLQVWCFSSRSRNIHLLLLLFCLSELVWGFGLRLLFAKCLFATAPQNACFQSNSVLCHTPAPPCHPGDRPLRCAASSPRTGHSLHHGAKGPTLLGLAAIPSVVLFSPDGHETPSLLWP